MTSHKPLKSISHNFGHSFISLMNYVNNDYLLGHILKQARITKLYRLEVDILNNVAKPSELLTKEISDSIYYYCKWFPELVKTGGSTIEFVKAAIMVIEFDLENTKPYSRNPNIMENPFTCEIKITDDRGKEYKHTHSGSWFPEL